MPKDGWARYHYLDDKGADVISGWIEGLQVRDKAILKQKTDHLQRIGPDEGVKLKLLAGPLRDGRRRITPIYKLHAKGSVQLRPMLCKGPVDNDAEFTILKEATEKNSRLIPPTAVEIAQERREIILADPCRRQKVE